MAKRLAAKQTAGQDRVVATNRRARHDYDLLETFECGIVLQGSEVKSLRTGRAQLNDSYARVSDGEVWQQLDGDHDIFGDGRVVVLSTPGHTRGHQSLMVKLDSQVVILLADAAYLLAKMRARLLPGILWSPDAMIATWDRVEALEREHEALLMTTHDLDYEERVKLAPGAWYE